MSPAYVLGDQEFASMAYPLRFYTYSSPSVDQVRFLYSGYRSLLSRPVNSLIFVRPWYQDTFVCGSRRSRLCVRLLVRREIIPF